MLFPVRDASFGDPRRRKASQHAGLFRIRPRAAYYTGPAIEDYVGQNGLVYVHNSSVRITITANEPTTYAIATTGAGSTQMLGFKSFGAGATFGADTSASPTGRLVTSTAITDGTIQTAGTAGWWAVDDGTRLLAHGSLSTTQVVAAGNTFSLGAFTIKIPAQ